MALSRPELLVVLGRADGDTAGASAETLLREVLAELTGTPAAAHVFVRDCRRCGDPSHGKPVLQHPSLHTSRSYAGGTLAVAVSTAGPVGVDVEQVSDTAFHGFVEVALAPHERDGTPRAPRPQPSSRGSGQVVGGHRAVPVLRDPRTQEAEEVGVVLQRAVHQSARSDRTSVLVHRPRQQTARPRPSTPP